MTKFKAETLKKLFTDVKFGWFYKVCCWHLGWIIKDVIYHDHIKCINGERKTQRCSFNPWFPLSYPQFAIRLGRDILWQYGAGRRGACTCGLIACIGSDWHGIGVPTWVSSYFDLPFCPWHALDSNNLFMLHTGPFIDAYGRLMKVLRWTKAGSEVALSHHCISSATHFDCWRMNQPQSVLE